MNNQQAIRKLQLLKIIQPSKKTLTSIKAGVYQQVKPASKVQAYLNFGNISYVIKSFDTAFYLVPVAFFIIFFLTASFLLFPNQAHNAILYGKLAVAPNQYEKARIAFDDTRSQFTNSKTAEANNNELAYSLTLTNSQLNGLQLKGERGKYTAQECHQIYQEYLTYLESKEKFVSLDNSSLRSKINSYEEQAERRLHMYNSL